MSVMTTDMKLVVLVLYCYLSSAEGNYAVRALSVSVMDRPA